MLFPSRFSLSELTTPMTYVRRRGTDQLILLKRTRQRERERERERENQSVMLYEHTTRNDTTSILLGHYCTTMKHSRVYYHQLVISSPRERERKRERKYVPVLELLHIRKVYLKPTKKTHGVPKEKGIFSFS